MLRKAIIVLAAVTIFMSVSGHAAAKSGCHKFKFTGTFLSPSQSSGLPNGNVHTHAYQLTINTDGTADQYWTGLPDYLINLGTGSPAIGSWTCRDDGSLLLVLMQGTYLPITPAQESDLTSQDVKLFRTWRTTYLFSVDDDNTLTRVQSRSRRYTPTQDPTDAVGGTLGPISNATATYKRLTASDADLLAP